MTLHSKRFSASPSFSSYLSFFFFSFHSQQTFFSTYLSSTPLILSVAIHAVISSDFVFLLRLSPFCHLFQTDPQTNTAPLSIYTHTHTYSDCFITLLLFSFDPIRDSWKDPASKSAWLSLLDDWAWQLTTTENSQCKVEGWTVVKLKSTSFRSIYRCQGKLSLSLASVHSIRWLTLSLNWTLLPVKNAPLSLGKALTI